MPLFHWRQQDFAFVKQESYYGKALSIYYMGKKIRIISFFFFHSFMEKGIYGLNRQLQLVPIFTASDPFQNLFFPQEQWKVGQKWGFYTALKMRFLTCDLLNGSNVVSLHENIEHYSINAIDAIIFEATPLYLISRQYRKVANRCQCIF